MTWRAFVLLGVLSGCGAGVGDTHMDTVFNGCEPLLLVPQDATAAHRRALTEATELWNTRAHTRLATDAALVLDPNAALPIRFARMGLGQLGIYEDEIGKVTVSSEIKDTHALAIVIAHEVGHAFGLWHVEKDQRTSVMNPANDTVEPNAKDVEAVWALWGECGR